MSFKIGDKVMCIVSKHHINNNKVVKGITYTVKELQEGIEEVYLEGNDENSWKNERFVLATKLSLLFYGDSDV